MNLYFILNEVESLELKSKVSKILRREGENDTINKMSRKPSYIKRLTKWLGGSYWKPRISGSQASQGKADQHTLYRLV